MNEIFQRKAGRSHENKQRIKYKDAFPSKSAYPLHADFEPGVRTPGEFNSCCFLTTIIKKQKLLLLNFLIQYLFF